MAEKATRSLRIRSWESARGCPLSSSMTSSSQIIGAPTSTPTSLAVCSSAATAEIVVRLAVTRIPSWRSRITMMSGSSTLKPGECSALRAM